MPDTTIWRSEDAKLVFEHDGITVLAFRLDDPSGMLPTAKLVKTGVNVDNTGTFRFVLPTNRRFALLTDSAWPVISVLARLPVL